MKGILYATVIGAILLLGGCATPLPKQETFEAGVFSTAPDASTIHQINNAPHARLAIILNDNTRNNTDYLIGRAKVATGRSVVMTSNQINAEEQAADPRFAINWIAALLKKRFGSVKLISSIEDFNPDQNDYLAVIDTFYTPIDWHWTTPTVDARFTIAFYDAKLLHIASAQGENSESISSWGGAENMRIRQHQVRVRALEQLDQKIDGYVIANAPLSSGDACVSSALKVTDPKLRASAITACNSH
jgi:hypothetical protein